jgi:hypothetical protein
MIRRPFGPVLAQPTLKATVVATTPHDKLVTMKIPRLP